MAKEQGFGLSATLFGERATPFWIRALEGLLTQFHRTWKSSVAMNFVYPVVYLTAMGVGLLLAGMKSAQDDKGRPAEPAKARSAGKPITMPGQMAGLEIRLGLKDTEKKGWAGEIEASGGKVLEVEVIRGG